MSEEQMFAFGFDEFGNCLCPAQAAGYSPNSGDESLVIAENYDHFVEEFGYGSQCGTLTEERAKEAWLAAVEDFKSKGFLGAETGEEIANELGWM